MPPQTQINHANREHAICSASGAERLKSKRAPIHKEKRTRLYSIWRHMRGRCLHPRDKDYPYYGAKGVKVCQEWAEFVPFREWALANGYADNLTIDRIDNNQGYSPDNCQWLPNNENCKKRDVYAVSHLTPQVVLKIRQFAKDNPNLSFRAIGRKFKITHSTVANILKGRTWNHVRS